MNEHCKARTIYNDWYLKWILNLACSLFSTNLFFNSLDSRSLDRQDRQMNTILDGEFKWKSIIECINWNQFSG